MMDARKLLINLLYRATSQSSELPGWSHRETKKPLMCRPGSNFQQITEDGYHRGESI